MSKIWRFAAVMAVLYATSLFGASQVLVRPKQASPLLTKSDLQTPVRVRAVGPVKQIAAVHEMSSMGRLAHMAATGQLERAIRRARAEALRRAGGITALNVPEGGDCEGDEQECEENEEGDGPAGGQAELSIAVDSSGQHVVVGNNDTRGFGLNPVSVSGYTYSDDGGLTFTDGGTLPVTTGTVSIGGTLVPQVFGDPEVKYLGGSNFIYFSIMVKLFAAPNIAAQTMCFHRSTDYGHTWEGPFEVTSATNPNGILSGGAPRDSADKEFADVDPDTGRVIMTWSNFTSTAIAPGGVEISSTFSDNVMAAVPTWSTRAVIAKTAADGQASLPRFAKGSNDVYVVWRRAFSGGNANVGFARSADNGATWSAPVSISPSNYFGMDQVLGNDRNNTSPGIGVDNSPGPYHGNLYVAVANNNNRDGADIQVQRSTNGGLTWSVPVLVNSRPGTDRAQWFPWVSVDSSTGRVSIFYYDQGGTTSGDVTETTYVSSDDGGNTWSKPLPLTDRPFHAGYGNDTGQPNIGDYNQSVAQNGDLFLIWAGNPVSVRFDDGQPTSSFTVPDIYFKRVNQFLPAKVSLDLQGTSMTDSGGNTFIDPSESAQLSFSLRNYVTNALSASPVNAISASLSSATPGVLVTTANATFTNAGAGGTVTQAAPFVLQVMPTFTAGTPIDLVLEVTTAVGKTTLLYRQPTGSPNATLLFSENFDGVAPGTLPAAFAAIHSGGTPTVPWTTNNAFMASPGGNAAFHQNANDGTTPTASPARFERLSSASINIPVNSEYVLVDFDVAYNTEDEPAFNVQAYDGFLLRVTDFTPGRFARANAVEAFADDFTTGSIQGYPKHMPRSGIGAATYLQDLSAWAGLSSGWQHVHMKLPGMNGATVQFRFEYTQDSSSTCADVRPGTACGVAFDNFVVKSVVSKGGTTTTLSIAPNPSSLSGGAPTATATVRTAGGAPVTAGTVTFKSGSIVAGPVALNASGLASTPFAIPQSGNFVVTAYYSGTATLAESQGSAVETIRARTVSTASYTPGQYSDRITLSASVTPTTFPGFPGIQGQFQWSIDGAPAAAAAVAADGTASSPYIITQAAGTYALTVKFVPSNSFYDESTSAAVPFVVTREDATVTSSGGSFAVGAPGGTANFALTAVIVENDSVPGHTSGGLGNINLAAPVTFTLTAVAAGPSFVMTATPVGSNPLIVSASFIGVPPNVYDVRIDIGGNYYTGSGTTVVSVYDPSLGFMTGGGTVLHDGVTANFGFNFKFKKNGDAQGNLNFIQHGATGDVRVKSTALDPLSIAGSTGIVSGKAIVNDVGGYSFRLVATDIGEPGSSDQFGLRVTDGSGNVVSTLSFSPLTLTGGNIQVPHN